MTPEDLAQRGLRVMGLEWRKREGRDHIGRPRDEWCASCDLLQNGWVVYEKADTQIVDAKRAARIAAQLEPTGSDAQTPDRRSQSPHTPD